MKQTALEWLTKEINILLGPLETRSVQDVFILDAIEQAKVMEKKQIIEAFKEGIAYWNGDEWKLIDIEAYYNHTFKSE